MHATIGAFSSGVITIPFSYSVKFEGLYGELNYPYCIHGKEYSTEEAVEKTIEYIENYQLLKNDQKKSIEQAKAKLELFKLDILNLIQNI